MLPLPQILWYEATAAGPARRQPEPTGTMDDTEQVRSYVQAYEWGGPTSALQLHHLRELSRLIRPGDVVLDLACGPGPLILELAGIYPDTTFVGADLSPTMLAHLRDESARRRYGNVSVLLEDIRTLPSIADGSVDLVISTSALHHLPQDEDLRLVFRRIASLLKPDGGFYLFDFGLVKSTEARRLFVEEVAKLAPPITAHDYELSLDAAFPIDLVRRFAFDELPRPFQMASSALVDIFYILQTPERTSCPDRAREYIDRRWRELSLPMRVEHIMLRHFRRTLRAASVAAPGR